MSDPEHIPPALTHLERLIRAEITRLLTMHGIIKTAAILGWPMNKLRAVMRLYEIRASEWGLRGAQSAWRKIKP